MTTFSLSGRSLKLNDATDINPHLKELREKATEIEHVILSGNTIGIGAAQALAEEIRTLHNLQTIDLSDIFTGRLISEIPTALKALCDSFIGLQYLHQVNLSDNAFGGRSVSPMVDYLESSYSSLKTLILSNNGLGPEGATVVADAVYKSAQLARSKGVPSVLQAVICGRNRLEDGSARAWARAFAAHQATLKQVRLFQNGIRMEGIAALARGLSECHQLQLLDLQDNTATEIGSRALGKAMRAWPNLVELNLNDLLLRPQGGVRICQALGEGSCVKLEILRLQSNELDSRTVEALATAVKLHCKALKSVEFNGNRCEGDDECMNKLRGALEANGHEDAIDEIDDVEEVDEEEDQAEDDAVESEEEDIELKQDQVIVAGSADEPAENVRASEADVVQKDKVAEQQEPTVTKKDEKDSDDLASMLSTVKI